MIRLLTGAGLALLALSAIVAVTGGFQTSVAGVQVSATSVSRPFFQGAVLLLVASCGKGLTGSHQRLLSVLALFLIAAAADSGRRRIGDGFEYMGMARNFARLAPPSLAAGDFTTLTTEMAARGDPTWHARPMPSLRGADDRYDFPHFWLCSLAAAPFVALASLAGLHPATGFAVLNIALLLGVCVLAVRRGAPVVAVLVAALLLWWADKAHAEVFIAALTAGGLLLRERAPASSLLLLGGAAAQMPVVAVLLAACAADAVRRHRTRRVVAAATAAGITAALHPLYYLWRLGITSPLRDTVIPHVPALREIVTPLVDLNLGVVWFAPVLSVLVVAGLITSIRQRAWPTLVPILVGAAALLVAATQTPNVNHGGTPGMSRYGVWLMAMLVPLAIAGETARKWPPRLAVAAVVLTVLFAAYALHPRLADAGVSPSPTALANLVWTHRPGLDNPLPEIFAERVGHVDGAVPLPQATERCEKALVRAGADGIVWPPGCVARAVPEACTVGRALCYANGADVVPAPPQRGFPQ